MNCSSSVDDTAENQERKKYTKILNHCLNEVENCDAMTDPIEDSFQNFEVLNKRRKLDNY